MIDRSVWTFRSITDNNTWHSMWSYRVEHKYISFCESRREETFLFLFYSYTPYQRITVLLEGNTIIWHYGCGGKSLSTERFYQFASKMGSLNLHSLFLLYDNLGLIRVMPLLNHVDNQASDNSLVLTVDGAHHTSLPFLWLHWDSPIMTQLCSIKWWNVQNTLQILLKNNMSIYVWHKLLAYNIQDNKPIRGCKHPWLYCKQNIEYIEYSLITWWNVYV